MFSLGSATVDYEPFPVCYIPSVFAPATYSALADSYPDISLFRFMKGSGKKFSLAEKNNTAQYFDFLNKNANWRSFHERVKSAAFIDDILTFLKSHHIDLGLGDYQVTQTRAASRNLVARLLNKRVLRSRFEFSVMRGDGGCIIPHTDAASKLITLVLSFSQPGEWNDAWGGGTDIVAPTDVSKLFNHVNSPLDFDAVSRVRTYPFLPNQALIFVKTFNSWHCVWPMTGPGSALRKTVTINIENLP